MRKHPSLYLKRNILSLFDARMFPQSRWSKNRGRFVVSHKMLTTYRGVTLQHVIGNIIRNARTDLYIMSNVKIAFMFKDGFNRKVIFDVLSDKGKLTEVFYLFTARLFLREVKINKIIRNILILNYILYQFEAINPFWDHI